MKLKGFYLLLAVTATTAAAESSQRKLVSSYAVAPKFCQKFQEFYSSFNVCSLTEEDCLVFKWGAEGNSELTKIPFAELATNQYGYTAVYAAHPPGKPYSFVYLNGFHGDQHPRQLETWKVKTDQLRALTEREPRPLQYNEWVKGAHQIKRETLAREFAQVLSEGEKLSGDSSPVWMPIFQADGTDYAVARECAGTWVYGGVYACNVINKVVVKRIAADKTAIPVCEYVRAKAR